MTNNSWMKFLIIKILENWNPLNFQGIWYTVNNEKLVGLGANCAIFTKHFLLKISLICCILEILGEFAKLEFFHLIDFFAD